MLQAVPPVSRAVSWIVCTFILHYAFVTRGIDHFLVRYEVFVHLGRRLAAYALSNFFHREVWSAYVWLAFVSQLEHSVGEEKYQLAAAIIASV